MVLNIVTRDRWDARVPVTWSSSLRPPVHHVYCGFSGTAPCDSLRKCCQRVRKMQRFDMVKKGLFDIQYNFLIGCDGSVYEGRGWANTVTFNGENQNQSSIVIGLIGDFRDIEPPDILFQALDQFLFVSVKNRYLAENFRQYSV